MQRRWLALVGVALTGEDGDFFPAAFHHVGPDGHYCIGPVLLLLASVRDVVRRVG
jgi:hypothetical protein